VKLTLYFCLVFLIGTVVGMQVARQIYLRADLEKIVGELHELSDHNASNAQLWLSTLEAVERGDTAKATRVSCLSLKIALSGIQPDEGVPANAAKTHEFLERARTKVAELQQSGVCAWHAPNAG
jgi:hypothetical protein